MAWGIKTRGIMWNPLTRWPRNAPCFCNKKTLKAKKCCMPNMSMTVKEKDYKGLRDLTNLMRLRWATFKRGLNYGTSKVS